MVRKYYLGFELKETCYGIMGKLIVDYSTVELPINHHLFVNNEPRNDSPLELFLSYVGEGHRTKKEIMVMDWRFEKTGLSENNWKQIVEFPNLDWEAKYVQKLQNNRSLLLDTEPKDFSYIQFWNYYNKTSNFQEIYFFNFKEYRKELVYQSKISGKPNPIDVETNSGRCGFEYTIRSDDPNDFKVFNKIDSLQGVFDVSILKENNKWEPLSKSIAKLKTEDGSPENYFPYSAQLVQPFGFSADSKPPIPVLN